MKKLSERAQILLAVVCEHTEYGEDGFLSRYFVPKGNGQEWCEAINEHVWVQGSGDASALKGLERRGLIERPPGCTIPNPYCYMATEDGAVLYQREIWPGFADRRERKGPKAEVEDE
jgi:hypothetical protein